MIFLHLWNSQQALGMLLKEDTGVLQREDEEQQTVDEVLRMVDKGLQMED